MITMPKKLKEKWVAALRSGEYEQCKGRLHDGKGYCCLGVLQMVADGDVDTGMLPSHGWIESHNVHSTSGGDDDISGFWDVTEGGWEVSLAYLNDAGESFNAIADIIEDQVVGT